MKRILLKPLALTAVVLLCQSVNAEVIRSSQIIGYGTGNLGASADTGTLDGWGNASSEITVTNGSGSLIGTNLGLVASAGDRVLIGGTTNNLSTRNQFSASGGFPQNLAFDTNVYYSFLYRFNNTAAISANGQPVMRLNRANSGTGTAQHWDLIAKNVGAAVQIGITKAGGTLTNYATTNLSSGQTFFVVVKQLIKNGAQNDVYDLWINPPAQFFGTNDANLPPASATIGANPTDGTEDTSNTGPGRLVVAGGTDASLDELRIATTWAEATPFFGQCVGAGVAVSPTNRTQSAEISTTFRVDALGTSPTIQWQRSTNSGAAWNNISGAVAETYQTPNLPLSASGHQYRAIVNVACNSSSATSAVATVTLTAPTATPVGVVMDDTFTDPDLGFDDRANEPLTSTNSLWYTSVTDDLTAFNQGGNMLGIPAPGSSRLWLGYFTATNTLPVHLALGRTIKVTLPFKPNSFNSFTGNGSLRIGLFDYFDGGVRITADSSAAGGSAGNGAGVRGYMLNLDFGTNFSANSPLQLLARNFLPANNLMGTTSDYESFGSGPAGGGYTGAPAFQAGTEYTLVFTVARIGENTCNVTASITGGGTNWSHSITDTNYAYHRFDSFALRPNTLEGTADSFTFPFFKVEVLQGAIAVPPFSITSVQSLSPTSVKMTWNSVSGATYHVLSRATVNGVESTNATIVATGSTTSYTNSPTSGSERYYRVLAPPYIP